MLVAALEAEVAEHINRFTVASELAIASELVVRRPHRYHAAAHAATRPHTARAENGQEVAA